MDDVERWRFKRVKVSADRVGKFENDKGLTAPDSLNTVVYTLPSEPVVVSPKLAALLKTPNEI